MAEYIVPVALVVGAVAAVAGAGVATYGAVRQAQYQRAQIKALGNEKEREAIIAQQNADFQEGQHRRRLRLLSGEQQATLAAAGVATTSGTPLVFDIDLATQGELEALSLKRAGTLASQERMFESGILGLRGRNIAGSIAPTVAGGTLSGIAGAASIGTAAGSAYRPTVTQNSEN